MTTTNIYRLTSGHRAVQAKRRAKQGQTKQVVFDDNARREFLTGFHKRKVARADAAQAKAKQKERQEKLNSRKERRRWLREKAFENAAAVERACGAVSDTDTESEEWQGIPPALDQVRSSTRNEEFQDEETLATVTVVEEFDPNPIHPPHPKYSTDLPTATASSLSCVGQSVKKRKIRYEPKQARQKDRAKQRARRTEKATRAGRYK